MTFTARITGDERVLVSLRGGQVVALARGEARKMSDRLEQAADDDARQLVLARATGNFKRGNER